MVDVDGVERIDLHSNFTTPIHGRSHLLIVERLREQVGRLTSAGLATEHEIALAEALCERVPTIEQVRFANSGIEVVLNAVRPQALTRCGRRLRSARAFTTVAPSRHGGQQRHSRGQVG